MKLSDLAYPRKAPSKAYRLVEVTPYLFWVPLKTLLTVVDPINHPRWSDMFKKISIDDIRRYMARNKLFYPWGKKNFEWHLGRYKASSDAAFQ